MRPPDSVNGHRRLACKFSEPLPAKPAGLSEATKLGISWIAALTLIGLTVALSVMRPRRIVASLRTVFVYLAALASAVWLTLLSKCSGFNWFDDQD